MYYYRRPLLYGLRLNVMAHACGLDFGTSNSTVGFCRSGQPALLPLEDGKLTLPSAVFFNAEEDATYFGRAALENYLAGSAKSEQAPAFIAHMRLARLKQQLGDPAAAGHEQASAMAMAREYNPAQDEKTHR